MTPRQQLIEYLGGEECRLSRIARHVGVALALYWMDEQGICSPSYEEIAAATGLSRRSVIRAVTELKAGDCLVVRRGGGRHVTSVYAAGFGSPNVVRETTF
jgi:hypothetical protein